MPSASETVLAVTGLAVGYGERVLLEDLGYEIRRGDIFAILGGSGCGKSTLMRHLIGLERPMRGLIRIRDVGGRASAEFAGTDETVARIKASLERTMGGRA